MHLRRNFVSFDILLYIQSSNRRAHVMMCHEWLDFKLLSEFVNVIKSIATAMELLQGEHETTFLRSVLLTLLAVIIKLKLDDVLQAARHQLLTKRYGKLLILKYPTNRIAITATTSHPKFRLKTKQNKHHLFRST